MREIDFFDEQEKENFTVNRVERLSHSLGIDDAQPFKIPDEIKTDEEGVQSTIKHIGIEDIHLLHALKTHAINSYRRDLQSLGRADLADFIISAPILKNPNK